MKDVIFGSVDVGAWRSRGSVIEYAERVASTHLADDTKTLSFHGVRVDAGWSSLALVGVIVQMMGMLKREYP